MPVLNNSFCARYFRTDLPETVASRTGEMAEDGSFTGPQVAFIYPDMETALLGEFR
jgi:hypothetical protein